MTMSLRATLFGLCAFVFYFANCQQDTTYWKKGGYGSLTVSNISLTNWAAGGQSSTALNGLFGLFADCQKERSSWVNSIDVGYGRIRVKGQKGSVKSDDFLNLVSKYGYKLGRDSDWYISALVDFRTQFDEGFGAEVPDSVISSFLAPGYLTAGVGLDYKPNPKLSFNYMPIATKFTIVADDDLAALGAYGVDPGENFRAELGSFFRATYIDEIIKNVNLDTRLELFTNYLNNFGVIDVNWQTRLIMKVNKVLSANLFTHLLYDRDIDVLSKNDKVGPKVQFKSVFGVGLAYTFGAKRGDK